MHQSFSFIHIYTGHFCLFFPFMRVFRYFLHWTFLRRYSPWNCSVVVKNLEANSSSLFQTSLNAVVTHNQSRCTESRKSWWVNSSINSLDPMGFFSGCDLQFYFSQYMISCLTSMKPNEVSGHVWVRNFLVFSLMKSKLDATENMLGKVAIP